MAIRLEPKPGTKAAKKTTKSTKKVRIENIDTVEDISPHEPKNKAQSHTGQDILIREAFSNTTPNEFINMIKQNI